MTQSITIPVPAEEDLGPKMRDLNPRQRAFVVAWFHLGDREQAALAAGYSSTTPGTLQVGAFQVWHNARVQEAIQEFARASVLGGLVPKSLRVLEDVLNSINHKDQVKVAEMVLNRTGMHEKSEHKVVVEKIDRTEAVRKVILWAKATGQDPRKLLGAASDVTDAEYEELTKDEGSNEGLEDLL